MATRIKDGIIPYTGGQGIEITNNHVINVLLRELNNLIQVNGDRELYVDLQLPDGIQPSDTFPVGVTTGKILAEDGWTQSGIILNWKTTSGDYVRLIYANDGKLYYDPGTGVWTEIGGSGSSSVGVATASTLGTVKLGSDTKQTVAAQTPSSTASRTYAVQLNNDNQAVVNVPWENTTYQSLQEEQGGTDVSLVTTGEKYTWNHKQDGLTPGANITIDQNNVISATIPQALVYKGNVTSISDLPASGTVGDTYFVEGEDAMYSWDGNQWNYVGGTGIDVTDLFNKTIDTSDNIVEGNTNLFVTQAEKNTWNNKQDTLTAGDNIQISNNVISATDTTYTEGDGIEITNQNVINNTAKFDPSNTGSLGQFLKKTNSGYAWADVPGGSGSSYTAGDGIDITNNVISATDRFTPTNQGNVGQVLKKSGANSYYWANESGGGSGDTNVKCFELNLSSYTQDEIRDIIGWINTGTDYGAIIKVTAQDDVFLYHETKVEDGKLGYYFLGLRYYADTTNSANGQFSTLYNQGIKIIYENGTYSISDYSLNAYANFLKVEDSGYTTPYMPTADYQPATKGYVDAVAAGSVQVPAITNNTTGTTYTCSQIWVGTQAQYDLITPANGVIYNIIPSS